MDTEVTPFPTPHRAAGRAACWASVLLAVVMGLRCSKLEGTSIPVDTRGYAWIPISFVGTIIFPGPSYSELRAKLEESETALAEAKATIGALKATIDGFEAKIFELRWRCVSSNRSEKATCPVRSKTFFEGGFHPASQKLWQHMGDGNDLHRTVREEMRWNTKGWNGPWVSGMDCDWGQGLCRECRSDSG